MTVISRLQHAVYQKEERRRLRELLGSGSVSDQDRTADFVLEAVRAAVVVAQYSIRSATTSSQAGARTTFGYAMYELWERSAEPEASDTGLLLPYFEHSLITLQAISMSESRGDATRQRLLMRLQDSLSQIDESNPSDPAMNTIRESARAIVTVSSFDFGVEARRARRPWVAVEALLLTPTSPRVRTALSSLESVAPRDRRSRLLEGDFRGQAVAWRDLVRAARERPSANSFDAKAAIRPDDSGVFASRGDTYLRNDPVKPSASALRGYDFDLTERDGRIEFVDDPDFDEATSAGLVPVHFGTNRAALAGGFFLNERDEPGTVHYGRCIVNIPTSHKFGSIGAKKKWWRRGDEDGPLTIVARHPSANSEEFADRLNRDFKPNARGENTVLVYVHGYNTSFDSAVIKAAQIGFDLKYDGAIATFSWPSKAHALGYLPDQASAEASEDSFRQFLTTLIDQTDATSVDMIVHSMGNKLLARTVASVAATAPANLALGTVILAAPDVDADVFRSLAVTYPQITNKTTMYVSSTDRALDLSRSLQDSLRAGYAPPVTVVAGIDTIDVSFIDVGVIGHGYYAEAAPVLSDIKSVLDGDWDPSRRIRLEPSSNTDGDYWWMRQNAH